jgi:hypothetical protein
VARRPHGEECEPEREVSGYRTSLQVRLAFLAEFPDFVARPQNPRTSLDQDQSFCPDRVPQSGVQLAALYRRDVVARFDGGESTTARVALL